MEKEKKIIAFGGVSLYGTVGNKVRELLFFLRKNLEYRYVTDEKEYKKIKHFISRTVNDLNARYEKTVPLEFKADDPFRYNAGCFYIKRPNDKAATLRISLTILRPYSNND